MTNLSPAAAVMIAYWKGQEASQQLGVAAALRAAADQVVPVPKLPYDSCCDVSASATRSQLLVIAAELEAQ